MVLRDDNQLGEVCSDTKVVSTLDVYKNTPDGAGLDPSFATTPLSTDSVGDEEPNGKMSSPCNLWAAFNDHLWAYSFMNGLAPNRGVNFLPMLPSNHYFGWVESFCCIVKGNMKGV